jgi:serine/threonine protein kinase
MFSTLASAVKYLHEQGIIHRDIKLENIFITEDGKVKLGDLGMSKVLGKEDELISTRVGTPVYFAPEVIQNQLYSFPVDIWSLGCVFYHLATLDHPFKDATM